MREKRSCLRFSHPLLKKKLKVRYLSGLSASLILYSLKRKADHDFVFEIVCFDAPTHPLRQQFCYGKPQPGGIAACFHGIESVEQPSHRCRIHIYCCIGKCDASIAFHDDAKVPVGIFQGLPVSEVRGYHPRMAGQGSDTAVSDLSQGYPECEEGHPPRKDPAA